LVIKRSVILARIPAFTTLLGGVGYDVVENIVEVQEYRIPIRKSDTNPVSTIVVIPSGERNENGGWMGRDKDACDNDGEMRVGADADTGLAVRIRDLHDGQSKSSSVTFSCSNSISRPQVGHFIVEIMPRFNQISK
jgi:hypothetical protein